MKLWIYLTTYNAYCLQRVWLIRRAVRRMQRSGRSSSCPRLTTTCYSYLLLLATYYLLLATDYLLLTTYYLLLTTYYLLLTTDYLLLTTYYLQRVDSTTSSSLSVRLTVTSRAYFKLGEAVARGAPNWLAAQRGAPPN